MSEASGERPRALLARHGLRPKKSWGQNFLHDERVVDRIVASAKAGAQDVVVEIGAGTGALTRRLAAAGCEVIAVERDPDLIPLLQQELGGFGNVTVVAADALEFDFAATALRVGRPLIVLGNLPYQITSPLLFRIVESAAAGRVVKRASLMVQKEVAERIVARPGSKIYGRLSVMVQAAAEAAILFHVGPGAFLPPPSVTSTVFSLTPRPQPVVQDAALFGAVVRAAFAGRRKMLRRSLAPAMTVEVLNNAFAEAGIAGTRRAEELSVEDFARLCAALAMGGASLSALRAVADDDVAASAVSAAADDGGGGSGHENSEQAGRVLQPHESDDDA